MALIKFGGGVVGMAGSIAGTTFARNRYGSYARARTKPVNPNSSRQQVIRAAMQTLTTRWAQTLTAPQRAAWGLYGTNVVMTNRLGESMNLSGFNHYIRSNVWRLDLGQTIVDDGPVIFELPTGDGTFAITASEATQDITIAFDDGLDWCSEDDAGIMLLQGLPQNAQRNFFAGPWRGRSAKMGNSVAPIVSPQTFGAIVPFAEGQHLWVMARILRADGRLSQPFRDDVLVAA